MKTNKKRLIACAAISLLAAVHPAGGREIEKTETAVQTEKTEPSDQPDQPGKAEG